MFLQNQFFFYTLYFKIMDRLHCIIFTWHPKLECFEMSRSLSTRRFCYALTAFHFLYVCAATYVLLVMKMKGLSTVSLGLHLSLLTVNWYNLLWRCFYTTKAEELVCYMNSAILLEKRYINSKFTHYMNI